jgi:SSS family solute:Na+ symporter
MLFVAGFRADVHTDILEFGVMFLGFGVLLPFAVTRLGGWEFLTSGLPPLHRTWHGGNPPQYIAVWFLIALWTLVDPAFHQRCYAAGSPMIARRGILFSIPCWFLFDVMTVTAGLYARAALPSLERPVMAYPALAEFVLPPVAKGVFIAGMFATVMSTLNSLAFIAGTSLGRDILWRRKGSPAGRTEVHLTRLGLAAASGLAVVLAMLIPSVIDLWYVIGTAIIPGLLVPLVTSYFDRWKVPPRFAMATMVAGWGTATLWLVFGGLTRAGEPGYAAFGIEPMFPGLAASLAVWGAGLRVRVRISQA